MSLEFDLTKQFPAIEELSKNAGAALASFPETRTLESMIAFITDAVGLPGPGLVLRMDQEELLDSDGILP